MAAVPGAHDRGVTSTYAAVDQSPDPAQAVTWQERLNERPAIRAYKENTPTSWSPTPG
jgi:hypothetical protein